MADNGFETVTRRDAGVEPTRTYLRRVEELVVCHRAESSEVHNAAPMRKSCIELINFDLVGLRTSGGILLHQLPLRVSVGFAPNFPKQKALYGAGLS